MLGLGLGLQYRHLLGKGYDSDYQAVLNYGTAQGDALPSESQQALGNALVIALKSAGVWAKLDSFALYATNGSASFALIDWVRLSKYTAVNSPPFTSNVGYKGDGTSAYINTNFNANSGTNFLQNSASIFSYRSSARTVGQPQAYQGIFLAGSYQTLISNSDGYLNNAGGSPFISLNSSLNFQIISRNSTAEKGYSNGVLLGTATRSSASLPAFPFTNFAAKTAAGVTFLSNEGQHLFGLGGEMTAGEVTDFNTAIKAYISSI